MKTSATLIRAGLAIVFPVGILMLGGNANAQQLTLDVEAIRIESVSDAWTSVTFRNSYASAVPVCTYALPSNANPPAIVRMRNVTSTGMEIRAALWAPSGTVASSGVHCLVVEEGVGNLPDGHKIEAHRIDADVTAGNVVGWAAANMENALPLVTQAYSSYVVVGQVITANDPEPSAFHASANARGTPPNATTFRVAKHIGMINGTRATETLGFILTEPGSGTVNGVDYAFGITANTVQGTGNSPPYTNTVSGDFDTGVATLAGENGGHGGWAVLYGADPLPANTLALAVEEETVAGDTTRTHISEEVAYTLFANGQTAALATEKTVDVTSGVTGYSIPGDVVDYTISVENSGTAPVDAASLFLVDTVPTELALFTGDLGAPGSGPVELTSTNSGLSLSASDVGFAAGASAPPDFSACTYTPVAAFDPAIRYLCLRPSGQLKAGSLETVTPEAKFRFRMQIL